ncbi:MAG: IS3 family transposase [Candidatus Omnitrophica bacterium]|nr:IS3 family transposase [Candidatus Omnitrophota bacterium]
MKTSYSIANICEFYGYSRQGYYKRQNNEQKAQKKEMLILQEVKAIRKRQPKVGGRKLQKMLKINTVLIGRDKCFDILRENELLVKHKRKYVITTNSKHRFRIYKNLIKDMNLKEPRKVFVSDITYIKTLEGFKYLSLITDKYSRKIVGYALSHSLSIEGNIESLKMALKGVKKTDQLTHHSDKGIQYCSKAYISLLKRHKVQISMTEENHVYENALAERVNGILKNELMLGETLISYKVAKVMVKEAIDIYNKERLHMSLDYMTPEQVHAA